MIGAALGFIASMITIVEGIIFLWKQQVVQNAMWNCNGNTTHCEVDGHPAAGDVFASFCFYILCNSGLVLGTALLTFWAPKAALSGLPGVLAYLNGVRMYR